ncbi:PRD domain-containing protein [Atopobium sp. BS2]|uniref:PRD domain-containing protein n=1 Tax=Atopobium sp. BS2 TaxID=936550 RepID=UPI0018DBA033|nr:PRD domain-containing protein [Atopobium sp. BS2]
MAAMDTKQELLRHLDTITRHLNPQKLDPFTTARIASDINVSRNLASQYLNDLVREGFVIKINTRPVVFMHKRGLERYLQVKLDRAEYASISDLMSTIGYGTRHDFDRAIGHDLSLAPCIEQLKSAIRYPTNGLPVLIIGEPGTGKALLSHLMFDYGINVGILPSKATYVAIDCADYATDDERFAADLLGTKDRFGHLNETSGGIVYLAGFEHLSQISRNLILTHLRHTTDPLHDIHAVPSARIVLSTSLPPNNPIIHQVTHLVPIVVNIPSLKERTGDERTDLIMHFLRIESRHVDSDIAISRGALRSLVEAPFSDNVDGLRTCITNCCASAYLNRTDKHLVIHAYNLPAAILSTSTVQEDDDKLVTGDKRSSSDIRSRAIRYFQTILDAYHAHQGGKISFDELIASALETVHQYEDYLNFEANSTNPRLASYEQVLNPLFERADSTYGIELSRKACHTLSQSLCLQLWGEAGVARWRTSNTTDLQALLALLTKRSRTAAVIVNHIKAETMNALGVEIDVLSQILLFIDVKEAVDSAHTGRQNVGIILAHGYSTATSIADAANRILHRRVFDAIDMAYDQRVSDVTGQLSRLLERYAYAPTIAILVDMGTLSEIDKAVHGIANGDLYMINNVSTGMALEVGSALISSEDIGEVLTRSLQVLTPTWHVLRGARNHDAVIFCSENGNDAAERIRQLVASSLPNELSAHLVTTDFYDLLRNGSNATVFSSYRVCAVMGTMDPGIPSIPFVGLEDIIANGSSEVLDKALGSTLGPEGIAHFHRELLRNVTLRSVVESITILNPERLYAEADRGLRRLQDFLGKRIEQRKIIGIYVHLCGLIERLVTKNFIDTHPPSEVPVTRYPEFIEWFRESFKDLCQRYKVEIPISEIAYVHDFIYGNQVAATPKDIAQVGGDSLLDE